MKGFKTFPQLFHRMVTAEMKKYAKQSGRPVDEETVMQLPFIHKHYHKHLTILQSFLPKGQVKKCTYEAVLSAVQFFRLLVTINPSPMSKMIKDQIPEAMIAIGMNFSDPNFLIPSSSVRASVSNELQAGGDLTGGDLTQSVHLEHEELLFLISHYFSMVTTAIDCHAVGRPLDQVLCAGIFDFLYSEPFKTAVDPPNVLGAQDTPVKSLSAHLSVTIVYLICTLRNLSANAQSDHSFLAAQYPMPMILHLIHMAVHNYCTCCEDRGLAIEHGLGLLKNIANFDRSVLCQMLDTTDLCEFYVRVLQKIWTKFAQDPKILIESCALLARLTDGDSHIAPTFVDLLLHLKLVPTLIQFTASATRLSYLAVRVIGNLAAAQEDEPAQALIDAGVIPR